jgi:3D (Asp-Asp-Asp) domain-containing protein
MAKSYEPPKGSVVEIAESIPVSDGMLNMDALEEIEVVENVEEEKKPEKPKPSKPKQSKPKTGNLGKFKITYYCPCTSCSGEWGYSTATGVRAEEGRTIAVDPKVIPYGSKVTINGHEYIAEDCGGAIKGNKIDIFIEDHDKANSLGVDYYEVYVER